MAIELILCRSCGSDNVEVIEAAGPGVGEQFYCGSCDTIAQGCAVQDAGAPFSDDDILVAQALVRKMRHQRDTEHAREWDGLSW